MTRTPQAIRELQHVNNDALNRGLQPVACITYNNDITRWAITLDHQATTTYLNHTYGE